MFYKPSDSSCTADPINSNTMTSNPNKSMDLSHTVDEQQDSGLDMMDFPRQPASFDSTHTASLTLGSISEVIETDDDRMESDCVDGINGNMFKLSLRDGSSCAPISERNSQKQTQSEVDHDSGLFDSMSSIGAGDASSCHVSTESCDVMSSHHWMAVLEHRCFTAHGHLDMDQVLGMFQGNQDGDNLLNLFIIHNLQKPAMFLIDHAPESDWLDLHNNLRQTPLHLAVMTRQPRIVKHLIDAHASLTEVDSLGNTPLHWACALGCDESARHLLEPERNCDFGRDVSCHCRIAEVPLQTFGLRNCDGDSCLHLAAKGGHLNIVQMLLNHGCDPNIGDGKSGRTVLHYAAESGHVALTSLLLADRRTQCDIEDYGRHTPHDLARGQERSGVMRLLISHGAKPTLTWGRRSSDSDSDDEDDDLESNMVVQNGHCSG